MWFKMPIWQYMTQMYKFDAIEMPGRLPKNRMRYNKPVGGEDRNYEMNRVRTGNFRHHQLLVI
jgi:hypothetical protein